MEFKYSPHFKTVNIKLSTDHQCSIVSVEDFGFGMILWSSVRFLDVFTVFQAMMKKLPVFGIGLFIVRHTAKTPQKFGLKVIKAKEAGSSFSIPLSKN